MSLGWIIVDRQSGKRISHALFLTRQNAEAQITAWQDRHDRGGRPDITREQLLRMEPAPFD